jgi:hypothetical protein
MRERPRGALRHEGLGVTTTRKWRRKPLESLKTDAEITIRRFAVAGKEKRSANSV